MHILSHMLWKSKRIITHSICIVPSFLHQCFWIYEALEFINSIGEKKKHDDDKTKFKVQQLFSILGFLIIPFFGINR